MALPANLPYNLERFQGGLVFKAHRLSHHSTLGSRVIKKKRGLVARTGQTRGGGVGSSIWSYFISHDVLIDGLRKSTPPQNRQLVVLIRTVKTLS